MSGEIGKTLAYLKRNGLRDTMWAAAERICEKRRLRYSFSPPSEKELAEQRGKVFGRPLKFSVVVPAYETPEVFLQDLILSVVEQSYTDRELVIADASESGRVEHVVKSFQEQYEGIRYLKLEKNGGISLNTNAAIEAAEGDYIALLDHDDVLTPDALFRMREAIDQADRPVLVYSDEDKCDSELEKFFEPNRKRDFDFELLLTNNYICHLSVFRADVIKELKLDPAFDGAQDHELLLRTALWTKEHYTGAAWKKQIRHVDRVLYHWRVHPASTSGSRDAKEYAYDAGRRAAESALSAMDIKAEVKPLKHLGFCRVEYEGGIFACRRDIGLVGGPVYSGGCICGGLMDAEGKVIFDGLPTGFSGYMHLAVLQQSAEAVDIRNIKLREDLIPLFKETTGYEWPFGGDKDEKRLKSRSLKFCNKLRDAGIGILYDPEQRENDKSKRSDPEL